MILGACVALAGDDARADPPGRDDAFFATATDEELLVAAEAAGIELIEVEGEAPEVAEPTRRRLDVDEIRRVPGAGGDAVRAL